MRDLRTLFVYGIALILTFLLCLFVIRLVDAATSTEISGRFLNDCGEQGVQPLEGLFVRFNPVEVMQPPTISGVVSNEVETDINGEWVYDPGTPGNYTVETYYNDQIVWGNSPVATGTHFADVTLVLPYACKIYKYKLFLSIMLR